MNDRELGQRLQQTGLPHADEARTKVDGMLDRDARRFRWLDRAVWALLATVGALLAATVWFVVAYVWPRQHMWLKEYGISNPWPITAKDWAKTEVPPWVPIVSSGVPALAVLLGLMLLVSLATILLALSARRNTIRHVNANLAELSEQMRLLRTAVEKPRA